jgi:hypothetical protein
MSAVMSAVIQSEEEGRKRRSQERSTKGAGGVMSYNVVKGALQTSCTLWRFPSRIRSKQTVFGPLLIGFFSWPKVM